MGPLVGATALEMVWKVVSGFHDSKTALQNGDNSYKNNIFKLQVLSLY